MGDLPAHHQHQAKTKHEEKQGGDGILNPDDLMVGGKNVSAPEPHIFVVRFLNTRMSNSVSGSHVCYFSLPVKAGSLSIILSCQKSKGVSELNWTAGVNRRMTVVRGYLILSSTINPSSNGKYKIEHRNNCRARGTVKCREN